MDNDNTLKKKLVKLYRNTKLKIDYAGMNLTTEEAVKKYCPETKLIPSRSIEPYYYENPWSMELQGKRLLVVHPFKKTIEKHFDRRTLLFNRGGLPE